MYQSTNWPMPNWENGCRASSERTSLSNSLGALGWNSWEILPSQFDPEHSHFGKVMNLSAPLWAALCWRIIYIYIILYIYTYICRYMYRNWMEWVQNSNHSIAILSIDHPIIGLRSFWPTSYYVYMVVDLKALATNHICEDTLCYISLKLDR